MTIFQRIKAAFSRDSVTLQLDQIQALILRARPEPYVGIHAMLHIDDAEGGRGLLAKLAEHIPSADDWAEDLTAWSGVAISYSGLKALGVPQESLDTFPAAFKEGMAARAAALRDFGENAPETWEDIYKGDNCHIALTIYAESAEALEEARMKAMNVLEASHGVTLMGTHEFGADEHAENPFGFRCPASAPVSQNWV